MLKTIYLKVLLASTLILLSSLSKSAVSVDDQAVVIENSGTTLITVFDNDTINKGESVTAFTQPANGVSSLLPGLGINYQPNNNYCNNGVTTDDFTYTLTGASTATVSVTVTCLAGSPPAQVIPVNQFHWLLFLLISVVFVAKSKNTVK